MNKVILSFLFVIIYITASANENGRFFIDLSSKNISTVNIIDSLSNYANFADGSTFILFRDETDLLGIRHQSYQQYYHGEFVQSNILLVHSKNGTVNFINGSIMTNSSAPKSIIKKISKKQATKKAQIIVNDSTITTVIICVNEKYYYAYKMPLPSTLETIYIDISTGEIIYRESAFQNADVTGRGYTRYNGWQNMTVNQTNNQYFLIDINRNIVTLSALNTSPNYSFYLSDAFISTLPEDVQREIINNKNDTTKLLPILMQYVYSPMVEDYIQNSCKYIYGNEKDFYSNKLKSITITSTNSSWWYDIWDTNPDIYCKIYDDAGNLVYKTNTMNDCSFPITINLPNHLIIADGYKIEIYDEDATSDSYGESVTITTATTGTKTWNGSNTSGSLEIEQTYSEYCDIHWGMQKTVDFYRAKFNRNSFDGKGHRIINLAFPPHDKSVFKDMPNNATAQGDYEPYFMYYGYGDGIKMNPVVSIDIMAHEFTHLVTKQNGNGGLTYSGESGALNESFSDIMGISVKKYATGHNDWLIGNDVMVYASNLRSMKNPNNSWDGVQPQPDTYNGTHWADITDLSKTGDNGGVHTNSGVQNYWFYLLSEGGSGTNDIKNTYNVKGIGIDKAVQIAYRNLIYYLTPDSKYKDSRNGSIQAAIDLYGKGSQEHQSVVNAWYAVGVGDKYQSTTPDVNEITVKAKMPSDWGNTIAAWVWNTGENGSWVTLEKEGEWYKYTKNSDELNIIFVNGTTWNGDNNQTIDITTSESACYQIGDNKTGKRTYSQIACQNIITVKAKMPSDWKNTISAWVWETGKNGEWVTLQKDGEWYKFSKECDEVNIVFVNGTSWSSNNNQTIDISLSESACLIINNNTTGKRTYTTIDCSAATNILNTYDKQPAAMKIIRNGRVYIIRNGRTYDLMGRIVE